MLTILHSLKRAQTQAPRLINSTINRGVHRPQHFNKLTAASLRYQPFTSTTGSQVSQDYQNAMKTRLSEETTQALSSVSRHGPNQKLPDYNVNSERLKLTVGLNKQDMPKDQHPIETMAKINRAANDIYAKLAPDQVLLTNLPQVAVKELDSEASVSKFLIQNVHKDLQVKNVQFINSLGTEEVRTRTAYIKVTAGSKRQAQMIKSNLRKTWLHDSLIKIRTKDDAKPEAYDNRTVIINGIPKHLSAEAIMKYFAKEAGAIVGVELPQENTKLRDLRREIAKQQDSPAMVEQEVQRKRTLMAIQDSPTTQQTDQAAQTLDLQKTSLQQDGKKLELERINGIMRLITRLQAEGKTVVEQKLALLEMKEQSASPVSVGESAALDQASVSADQLKEIIEKNKDQVVKSLEYLRQNGEQIAQKAVADSFSDLLRLSKEELAVTYDRLIEALSDRENAIESRLRKSIEHFGIGERILVQGKNFAKELEDVANVGGVTGDTVKPEQIISINQQVHNVLNAKHISTEDKVYRLLSQTLNPFETKHNFNSDQLRDTTSRRLDNAKVANAADPRIAKSLQRMFYEGTEFLEENKPIIEGIIDDAKDTLDTPFDEIYHAQKKVIQDVIDAEKALQDKVDSLKNPADHLDIDINKASAEQRGDIQDILDRFSSPFTVSQRRKKEALLDEKLKQAQSNGQVGSYKFDYSETADLQQKIDQGLVSKKQAQQMKQLLNEGTDSNLGYVFLTFSHADEARLFLLQNPTPYYNYDEIEILLKSHLDHSAMDMQFFMAQARNEAKTVDEIQAVRDARLKLREFEKDMDSQLPSRKRLQKARRFAQSLIEDHKYLTKNESYMGEHRTQLEQDQFDRKVKEFEAAHPGIDLTPIYENEKTEAARRALHKKAYASYKAFHFLKNGVKRGDELQAVKQETLSSAKKRLQDNDPYNFPALDRTVKTVLRDDIDLPQLNDAGDHITKPGRRVNGYSEQEYLESFFGKDMARRLQTESLVDPLYHEQKSLKELYPLDSFLKTPALNKKKEQLAKLDLEDDYKKFPHKLPKDADLAEYYLHRRFENDVMDRRAQLPNEDDDGELDSKNMPASMASEWKKIYSQHLKKNAKHHAGDKKYVDTTYLRKAMDELDFAFEQGKYKDDADWFKLLKDPRQKRDIVEQRMYELEHNNELDNLSQYVDHNIGYYEGKLGQREVREDKPEGETVDATVATDEKKEAKFEAEYDGDSTANDQEESSVRKNRQKRDKPSGGARKSRGQKDQATLSNDKDALASYRQELESLKLGRKGAPLAIGRSGEVTGADEVPEGLSSRDYRIARMMASISPEERQELQGFYDNQRQEQLEQLEDMYSGADGISAEQYTELAEELGSKQVTKLHPSKRFASVMSESSYMQRDLKEQGHDINTIEKEEQIMRHGSDKEKIDLKILQRKRGHQQEMTRKEAEKRFTGSWFRKYQAQADEFDEQDDFSQTRKSGKMLDEFIQKREGTQAEDSDDDDIYRQYQEMASRSKENSASGKPDFSSFAPKQDELKPEMPSFEEYFQAEAEGVHPFDRISNSFDPNEINTPEEHEAEIEREKNLYQRQLLGKLIGQRLTASEYEILNGFHEDQLLRQKRVLDTTNQEFLANRQQVRLMQEQVEKIRIQKVMAGEWSEGQSHQLLQNYIEEQQETFLSDQCIKQQIRDLKAFMIEMKTNQTSDFMHEKEYHFDEGVGVSLDQHVESLKDQYPKATVQTRRDRDGFAIIKLSFRPEYKYDIDQIMSLDQESMKHHKAESLEAILEATGSQAQSQNFSPKKLEQVVHSLSGKRSMKLSSEDELTLKELTAERINGIYKDDVQGFVEAIKTFIETSDGDLELMQVTGANGDALQDGADDLFNDRERFRTEIAEQLNAKITQHIIGKKRVTEDFVKPKFNEASLYASLDHSANQMEQKVGETDTSHEEFDRDAYDRLKKELSERKRVKEDMLTGTLPRFRPYLRL